MSINIIVQIYAHIWNSMFMCDNAYMRIHLNTCSDSWPRISFTLINTHCLLARTYSRHSSATVRLCFTHARTHTYTYRHIYKHQHFSNVCFSSIEYNTMLIVFLYQQSIPVETNQKRRKNTNSNQYLSARQCEEFIQFFFHRLFVFTQRLFRNCTFFSAHEPLSQQQTEQKTKQTFSQCFDQFVNTKCSAFSIQFV